MSNVHFKLAHSTKPMVFKGAEMATPVGLDIFFSDLRTQAGGTQDWRVQEFDVGSQSLRPIAMSGKQLCQLTLQESTLPPHSEQPKRAYEYLPTQPWHIRARAPPSKTQQGTVSAVEPTASSASTKSGGGNQLPFGIFIRSEIRDVIRDLPRDIKIRPAIQELLTADPPEEGLKINWTPHNSALIKRQADALRRIGKEVRLAEWARSYSNKVMLIWGIMNATEHLLK